MICGSRCLPHVPPRVLPKFVDPAKQQRDLAACIRVARDRLAVDDARAHRQHRNRRRDLSEASGKVDAFSGKEPHSRAVADRDDAKSVVLDLVNPTRPGWRLLSESGQARFDAVQLAVQLTR